MYCELNGLQEIMVRKLAREHTTPWFIIKVTKRNKIDSKTTWKPGNRYEIKTTGNHIAAEIAFNRALNENLIYPSKI